MAHSNAVANKLPYRPRRPKRHTRARGVGRVDVREVLSKVVDRHVAPELQRLTRIRNLWIEILPESFADHVWPTLVQGDRLLVHVHDSQWLHEMTYWRQEVLDRLAVAWPESEILRVEASVGPIPPRSERRPAAPPPPPVVDRSPVLEPDVPTATVDALNEVRDARLREVLARARWMLGKPR